MLWRTIASTDTPRLREIHIGSNSTTSYSFTNCPVFALSDLESLEEVQIGQGCFVFSNVLSLRHLPALKRLSIEKDSFFYISKLVLLGNPMEWAVMRRTPITRTVYHSSLEFAASVNQTDWQWNSTLHCLFESQNGDRAKIGKRAYTGIEPVTSRTLSENHTTRPAGRCFSFQFILHHRHTEPMISKRCYHERTIHSLLYFTCGNTPILRCFSQIILWSERVWLFVLSVDFGSESTCGIEGNQESVLQGEN